MCGDNAIALGDHRRRGVPDFFACSWEVHCSPSSSGGRDPEWVMGANEKLLSAGSNRGRKGQPSQGF